MREKIDWALLERFYLYCAARAYAAEKPVVRKTNIPQLPGSEVFFIRGAYEFEELEYVDCYFAPKPDTSIPILSEQVQFRRSSGYTTITLNGMTVWMMHYGGYWNVSDPRILPFLKHVLRMGTSAFFGGRGPHKVEGAAENQEWDGLVYHNNPDLNMFANFGGQEMIRNFREEALMYFHWYHGGLLLPINAISPR